MFSLQQSQDSPLDIVHNAYRRLTHNELLLFLKIRNLPTSGTDADLASRLTHHDLHTYHFPIHTQIGREPSLSPPLCHSQQGNAIRTSAQLPIEIIAEILEHNGDWELTKAVGVPTSLSPPSEWSDASCTDHAMLHGYVPFVIAADPASNPPTRIGAALCVRFDYVNVLDYLLSNHFDVFTWIFRHNFIPITASYYGRTATLSWWHEKIIQHHGLISLPSLEATAEAIDGASRNGQVASLEWWLSSGLPFEYTERALEDASSRKRISVLEWWKQHQGALPLKIGRVVGKASIAGHVEVLEWWAASQLEFKYDRTALHQASSHGKIEVLDWWLGSGLQLKYDQDALIGATRHNRAEVLEWWDKCGLPIQYRMCDIEEALEDAIGGGDAARTWWKQKGVDFDNADDKEWTKLRSLN
jgi:hypothetical protein